MKIFLKPLLTLLLFAELSSCNYQQFFTPENDQLALEDSIKRQNDSLLSVVQAYMDNANRTMGAKEIYNRFVKSTVTIVTENGLGSGFYIAKDLIATNYHVIEGASRVGLLLKDAEEVIPVLGYVAINKSVDLAILQTDRPGEPILVSKAPLSIGDKIFAIGSPRGLNATISEGIVSAKRSGSNNYYIQITAPISPGSSGGPVLNERGEVIGVSVLQVTEGQNLNFAIPAAELEILTAFKSDVPLAFSNLIENRRNQSYYAERSVTADSPINEEGVTEWNEQTRVEFIQSCIENGDPNDEYPGMFEFCDCVYQKIIIEYAPEDIGSLSKRRIRELAESCAAEIE